MTMHAVTWRCRVCGYLHKGDKAPKECPQCAASQEEFVSGDKHGRLVHDGKKVDVLLINGSSHSSHNTGYLTTLAEKKLKSMKVSYRRVDLSGKMIYPCWCCYSMGDAKCTYPCRNQLDDASAIHKMMIDSRAIIVLSPINWNSMSGKLKLLLDRCTSIENQGLLGKTPPLQSKTFGVIVNGHEDGAMTTALDIWLYFQEMGCVSAPFSFGYRTHNAQYNAGQDNRFFRGDRRSKEMVDGVVNNVVRMMRLGLEKKLKGIKTVCE